MNPADQRPRVAIVGDYEGVQARSGHVDRLRERAEVTVWQEPIAPDEAADVLRPFPVVIAIRERTPFPAELLAELPALELISQSGTHAAHVDLEAAAERGVLVASGRGDPSGGKRPSIMPELVFGLLMGLVRELPRLHAEMAAGAWPSSVGRSVRDKTMGILGLGRHGTAVARVAQAFGMRTVAWGPTLTAERAAASGVEAMELDALLAEVDVLSIHLRLSDLSRGLLDRRRIGLLKREAIVINTARGAIIDEEALADALAAGELGGAGLDVFTEEPLPADSPLRGLPHVLLTPHVGWTVDRNLEEFAEDTTAHVLRYLDGRLRVDALLNPGAAEVDRPRLGGIARGDR